MIHIFQNNQIKQTMTTLYFVGSLPRRRNKFRLGHFQYHLHQPCCRYWVQGQFIQKWKIVWMLQSNFTTKMKTVPLRTNVSLDPSLWHIRYMLLILIRAGQSANVQCLPVSRATRVKRYNPAFRYRGSLPYYVIKVRRGEGGIQKLFWYSSAWERESWRAVKLYCEERGA